MGSFLISGINGFIGSHIADRLLSTGNRVRGLVRKTSRLRYIEGLDVELCYGDLRDAESLNEAVKGIDTVIHAGALVSEEGPRETFIAVNVQGTENLARSAHRYNVRRFVHMSTVAVHGFAGFRNRDETFPMVDTIFPYCQTKKATEEWLFRFAESVDMEITVIRPGNVFGPRDHTYIGQYLDALQKGRIVYIDGGRHWTCPTYIDNLVDGVVGVSCEPSARGEAFIITDGLEIDWKTFTDTFADELGVKRPRVSVPYWCGYSLAFLLEMSYRLLSISKPPLLTRYRISNGGRDYHFSIEKAKGLLGYEPSVDFSEAVRRTVGWFIQEQER